LGEPPLCLLLTTLLFARHTHSKWSTKGVQYNPGVVTPSHIGTNLLVVLPWKVNLLTVTEIALLTFLHCPVAEPESLQFRTIDAVMADYINPDSENKDVPLFYEL